MWYMFQALNDITSLMQNYFPQIWTLVGIYIGVAILGFIMVSVFIDKLPDAWLPVEDREGAVTDKIVTSLGATIRHLCHANQLLLIPLTIYSGLEQTFYDTEYTKVGILNTHDTDDARAYQN